MAETVGGSLTIPFVFPVPEAPPAAPAPSGGGDPVGAVPMPAQPAPTDPVGGGESAVQPTTPASQADAAFTPSAFFQPVTFDLTSAANAGGMGTPPVQTALYEEIFRSFGDEDKYFWWL